MNNNELGIYIHIPFCKQKCYYCDFVSYSNKQDYIEKYFLSMKKEIDSYKLENYNVTTIYIGGGTPSFIDSGYIKDILNKLKQKLKNNATKFSEIEITIEVNPGTVDRNKLLDYKNSGVNRLSIGLQTTNDNLLKLIGRIHTFEQFLEAYNVAESVGFDNINVDLMLGLPEQNIEDLKNSIEEVLKLAPNHISVYSLIVEDGTRIAKLLDDKIIELPDEDMERKMYWYVKNKLELNGYNHYEISNFSKKGKESKHNVNCWEQKEYIGIGAAAHSYLNKVRYSNVNNIEEYIEIMNNNVSFKNNRIINEVQDDEVAKKESMLLGLRKIEGVRISKFKEKFVDNPIYLYRKEIEKLVREELIVVDGDYIKLTNKGLDLANLVWEEFV